MPGVTGAATAGEEVALVGVVSTSLTDGRDSTVPDSHAKPGGLVKDLHVRTIRAGLAKGVSQGLSFFIRLLSLMVLARLLDPQEFGLVAMVGAVTGVLNLLKDAGLSMATVQRANVTHEQTSTLFWVNVVVGLVLAVGMCLAAPAMVAFYREPRLYWITIAFGLGFVLNGLGVQHGALLQREMRFTGVSINETVALILATAVGIGMAAAGAGYWALVATALIQPAATSVGAWYLTGWMPGRPSRSAGVLSLVRFGGAVTLNSVIVYVAYNAEKVLLGRFWGASALGLYGRAYTLINIPTENLNSAAAGVAFSALSRVQDDPPRLKKYFLKGYALVLALTVPITIASGFFSEDIVAVTLGPKWSEAAPLLRLLAPTILVFALINPLSWFLLATDRVARSLKMALVIAPSVVGAYLVGLPHGPRGVALAYSVTMALLCLPILAWGIAGTTLRWRDLFEAASKPVISGGVAVVACAVLHYAIDVSWPPLLRFALEAAVLGGTYTFVLLQVMGQGPIYLQMLRRLRDPADSGPPETLAPAANVADPP
jgi:PST family polysaccharide transporter